MSKSKPIRELALLLLSNHYGIDSKSYYKLYELLKDEGDNDDILNYTKAIDDYFYLPEKNFEFVK